MDYLKSQLDRIQLQLKGLNASQKMLTASLVAVMVLTLLFYGRYAGQSEMEPVLGLNLTEEQLAKAAGQLDAQGIPHKVLGGQIHTTADKKVAVMGLLSYNSGLPKDTTSGFDQIMKQLTPWDGQSRSDAYYNQAKQLTLERMISTWPGVSSARVLIDSKSERRIGRQGDLRPTATANIQMRDAAKPGKQLINAAANLIAGANAGLSPADVKVIVDGAPYAAQVVDAATGAGGLSGDSLMELRLAAEEYFSSSLRKHLQNIDGVLVSVHVHVNPSSIDSESLEYDKATSLIEPQEQTNKAREDIGGSRPSGEPGAVPNLGISLGDGAGGGSPRSSSDTIENLKNFIAPGVKKKVMRTKAGHATPQGVSVRVPRSFFVNAARQYATAGAAPDVAAVNAAEETEIQKIRKAVTVCTGIKEQADIAVDTYTDLAPTVASVLPTATASSLGLAVGGHAKEIALGALALVSLFMISMIVKKGTPAMALPTPAPRARMQQMPALHVGENFAGEAAVGNPLLDGMELDDEAVRTQQMLSQVSDMVDDNPDAAAALVKRWLNRS